MEFEDLKFTNEPKPTRANLARTVELAKCFMEEYKDHSIIVGKKVNVISGMKTYPATAKSVDNNGHLIVQTDDGAIHSLSYGEVSIRPEN